MTTHIAFLRGINVGAHNRMTMEDLRAAFDGLGYGAVETYIQSGNVVFEAAERDEGALREDIRDAIGDTFGYDVEVMVRTGAELEAVVAGLPFEVPGEGGVRHYVTFLHEVPGAELVGGLLEAGEDGAERFEVRGREVYSELDKDALGDGRFTDVGRVLGMPATRRNWDVVTAVNERAQR